jgi:iron-sulfur cluster assembly accessory protein
MELIEITDNAITKLLERKEKEKFNYIRLGITGGGCAGFEYVFDSVVCKTANDIEVDFGEIKFVIDKLSVPYINGMTLDFQKEGLNEVFKFINPKEEASCGCGVSINFDLSKVEIDEQKIFAVEV